MRPADAGRPSAAADPGSSRRIAGRAQKILTSGGVALDSRTVVSERIPGPCIAGEILDLDGFIDGYNFQAAFSTGWLVGESV